MDMSQNVWVWLVLRLAVAWMFFVPLSALIADWQTTRALTRLVTKYFVGVVSVMYVAIMVVGGLSILLGFYAQIGGILLCIYCLFGIRVHFQMAKMIGRSELPPSCIEQGEQAFSRLQMLGILGQVSSGQKNVVLAAISLVFAVVGTGPYSLSGLLW